MTDSQNQSQKIQAPLTLRLKTNAEAGGARAGHAKGRSVQVEVKKKRSFAPASASRDGETVLSSAQAHRLEVLKNAMKADEENRIKAEELARQKAIEAEKARIQAEKEEAERKEREERLKKEQEEAERKQAQERAEAQKKQADARADVKPAKFAKKPEAKPMPASAMPPADDDYARRRAAPVKHHESMDDDSRMHAKKGDDKWRSGRVNLNSIMRGDDDGEGGRRRSLASIRRAREKERQKIMGASKPAEKVYREVIVPETITVQELASRMSERAADVIKQLMKLGVMATITQTIDADTAQIVVEEMGHRVKRVADADVEEGLRGAEDKEEDKLPRPPVVTVMGHVDHGKTSLLDALRSTNVAGKEAGGITQHIGAYQVHLQNGQRVTFIDTPGHAAFTEMRARGAQITDIVILVVAANDGIMPQTIEAIRHAKAAGVPIVVAINKIDVPGANPQKVRTDLLNHEVVVESMGGDVLAVEVSAKKRINLEQLVEAVLLQAEVLDLKANPNRMAEGTIVEAKMEKGRGSVATVLVRRGTLRQGDVFVAGNDWGRVRALVNEHGERVDSAAPSEPVEVLGLQSTPSAGDDFIVVANEEKAREIAAYRQRKEREALQVKTMKSAAEQMLDKIKAGEIKELPLVVKADVQGSVEALVSTLSKIATDKVRVNILHAAVGGINESDVTLAKASNALVIGFNVRSNTQARMVAKRDGVEIRYYSVIYNVADDVKAALEGLLPPEKKEKILGYAKIREVFNISKVGKIAGAMVKEGMMKRGAKVRLLRENVVYHTGVLAQLKRFKDDAREVKEGFECGMLFENFNDIAVGDAVECFEVEEVAAKLDNIQV